MFWRTHFYQIAQNNLCGSRQLTNGGDAITEITQKHGSSLNLPNAKRTDYTFGGWFTDVTLNTNFELIEMPMRSFSIYAYWSEENKPSDFTYSGTTALTVSGYKSTSTTMWIPSYIGGVPVTTIPASAFENKAELLKVVVPDTVTEIGNGAFKGCVALEDITLPFVGASEKVSQYSLQTSVFGYIFGMTSAHDSQYTSATKNYGYINTKFTSTPAGTIWQFSNTANYSHSYVGTSYYDKTSYFYYIPTTIKTVTITNQTIIPVAAFNNCDFIKNITLPTNVTSIGDYAFQNCTGLTRLNSTTDGLFDLPTNIAAINQYTFKNCNKMTHVTVPANVTNISTNAFDSCVQLANVEFATGSKLETIGNYAFNGCIAITKLNSKNDGELLIPEHVATIGEYAFQNIELMNKIVIPDSVTSIGLGAFKGCTAIEDITLPFVGKSLIATYHEAVFGYIFGYKTDNISTLIYRPNDKYGYVNEKFGGVTNSIWQYSNYSIYRENGYYYQTSWYYYIPTTIKNVIITNQTNIPVAAFNNCYFIKNITLPTNVTSMGDYAFQNCSNLKIIYYEGSESNWSNISIGLNNDCLTAAKLYYYSEISIEGNYWHYVNDVPTVWNS